MTDVFSKEKRSWIMSQIKGKNTKPELIVRKILHRSGYRYCLHAKKLPGKPDIVLPKYHKIIFVHGCFWHGHKCRAGRNTPKSKKKYWHEKLNKNKIRDKKHLIDLSALGWEVLVVWECEVREEELLDRLIAFIKGE